MLASNNQDAASVHCPSSEFGEKRRVVPIRFAETSSLLLTVTRVSSLYRDPKSISRVFRFLGRGADLLTDKKIDGLACWENLRQVIGKLSYVQRDLP